MFDFTARFLIEAAASQAKKDALAKKYTLEPSVIDILADVDPTPTGDYMEWLAREASRTHLPQRQELSALTAMFNEYIKVKRNPAWTGEKNILNLSYEQFDALMQTVSREDYGKKQKVRDIEENAKKYISEGVKYLGKVADCYVYRPITAVASAAMSEGTHWCTKNEGTSASYLSNGDIYVVTKPDYQNSYGNDKYIQIYVSPTKIEIENAEGKDLSSTSEKGLIYTEECMALLGFLGDMNELVKAGWDDGSIHLRDEDTPVCHECGEPIEEGNAHEANGDDYCENCFYDLFSYCDGCGDFIDVQNGNYISTEDGYLCNDCGRTCPDCDQGYYTRGRHPMSFYEVTDGNDREICEKCYLDNYFSCEKCDNAYPNDDRYEFNEESVCQECFNEDWDEEVKSVLKGWIETSGLEDKITKEVKEQAEKIFQKQKKELVGSYFKKMQEAGYLYSWEDLDLETALSFVWDGGITGVLQELYAATKDPISYAIDTLTKDMKDTETPTYAWETDEVVNWLQENDILSGDDVYQGCDYFQGIPKE